MKYHTDLGFNLGVHSIGHVMIRYLENLDRHGWDGGVQVE